MLQTKTKTCPDCNGVGIDEFDPTMLCGVCLGEGVVDHAVYHQYKQTEREDRRHYGIDDEPRFEKIPRRRPKYV